MRAYARWFSTGMQAFRILLTVRTYIPTLLYSLGCDMFEYTVDSGLCRFHPHTPLKSRLWATVAERSEEDVAIYVLQCSTATEDILGRHSWANQVNIYRRGRNRDIINLTDIRM